MDKKIKKRELDIDKISHIDLTGQIDNPWERDSILTFANKVKKYFYPIRLRNKDKFLLKKKFINELKTRSSARHNKKVINFIFAYKIFKLLNKIEFKNILICPDHRPSKEVHHYIQKLSYNFGIPHLTKEKNISFIDRKKYHVKKNTPAHKHGKKVLKGKKEAEKVNIKELIDLLGRLL